MFIEASKEMNSNCFYINSVHTNALNDFTNIFSGIFQDKRRLYNAPVFLCIGTDRIIGDCLGPLIGNTLKNKLNGDFKIYGTLDEPVHAKNLEDTVQNIHKENKSPFIIAIDASLGHSRHIGFITLGEGALNPGRAVKKPLPSVGDVFITGIVNFSGMMEIAALQNTRLSTVMKMSEIISSGILASVYSE